MLPKQRLARAEKGPAKPTADLHVMTGRKVQDLVTGTRAVTGVEFFTRIFPWQGQEFTNELSHFVASTHKRSPLVYSLGSFQ